MSFYRSPVSQPSAYRSLGVASADSLRDSVAGVQLGFSRMRRELDEARREVERLRRELDHSRGLRARPPEADVSGLRKRAALYCHPDRGGDDGLMRRLNAVFDYLEDLEQGAQALGTDDLHSRTGAAA
ncbi:MAG: hypothetical protein OEZ06_14835 [Myxococcales bacterium]|nr:hypothetical protein [Myxococcales bacterium]